MEGGRVPRSRPNSKLGAKQQKIIKSIVEKKAKLSTIIMQEAKF